MFRLQTEHLEVLTEFMENHPDFARGRLSVSNAREKFKDLWSKLTNKLNALGLGEKTIEKWQKTWSDYKLNLKKKAAEKKKYQDATGGGPPCPKKLTDLELKILAILGNTFYAGIGVEEKGLALVNTQFNKEKSMTTANIAGSSLRNNNQTEVVLYNASSSTVNYSADDKIHGEFYKENVLLSTPSANAGPSSIQNNKKCPEVSLNQTHLSSKKRSADDENVDDHDYLFLNKNLEANKKTKKQKKK